ncbi:MAG: divalent-cation tolerance protein CutA [Chloroflexi bacterium]|nr:divalent-cation tolerance protein CutA [Chloroflexota bacterium]MBM4450547.1 divalent-cation tolerance protein CutA [Chloroflexota bacterium]
MFPRRSPWACYASQHRAIYPSLRSACPAHRSLLIIEARASVLPEVIELVKQAHSYTVPEVIALPIIGGNEDYLKWVDEEVRER